MALFEIKDIDKAYYAEHIEPFVPERLVDMHAHVYTKKILGAVGTPKKRVVSWPSLVADEDPIEDLMETYELMFPGKQVVPCIFHIGQREDEIDEMNRYVGDCAARHRFPALLYTHPSWPAESLKKRLTGGTYQGIKVYLHLSPSYIPEPEIRIFDFLTPAHLEVLNMLGLIVMLHIPRPGRLKDPVNIAQILEIEEKYPDLKLILAHVGRAYCREDVGTALDILAETERLVFDFSANTNSWVFARTIEAVGPKRILFGSDLPIARMRMRRICEDGCYINLVPKGLYGDVSGDRNMREVEGEEAKTLSFFLYEEIKAFRKAAEETGLDSPDIEDIFCNNAVRILESVGFSFDGK